MGFERFDGQEGDLAALCALQILDEVARVVGSGGDDVLHGAAERRFDGDFVLFFTLDDVGNDAENAGGQFVAPAGVAHQFFDGEFVVFKIVLDVFIKALPIFQRGNAGVDGENVLADLVFLRVEGEDLPFLGVLDLLFAGDVLYQFVVPVVAGSELFFVLFQCGGELFRRRGDLGNAFLHRLFAGGEIADVAVDLGEVFQSVDDALLRFAAPCLVIGEAGVELFDLLFQAIGFPAGVRNFFIVQGSGLLRAFQLVCDLRQALFACGDGFFLAVFLFSEKGDSFANDLDVPFFLLQFDGEFQDSVVEVLQQFIALGDAVPVLVVLIAQALYVRPALFEAGIDPLDDRIDGGAGGFCVVVLVNVQIDLVVAQFFVQFAVFFCLFRLPRERREHMLHLAHALQVNIQIVVGVGKAALDVLFARLEHDDARRFLKDGAAVFGLCVHDLFDLALPDDGIPLFAQPHAVQTIDDVFHAAGLFVDEVFALPAAEKTAREGDLLVIEVGKHMRGIIERERHFAERLALARLCSAENDVLHTRTAHRLCRLFTEHPANGIGNVALAAAVRPDDAGHAVIEFDFGFVRKGLETVEFDFFEIQVLILPLLRRASPTELWRRFVLPVPCWRRCPARSCPTPSRAR